MMELAVRARFRRLLLCAASPALRALADAIVANDGRRLSCWGNLADHVLERFDSDDDLIALWGVLIDGNDRRPMLLFLDVVRDRPNVLRAIVAEIDQMPPEIQCALVSMNETTALLEPALPHLSPAALEIVAGGEEAKAKERIVYEAHMASLRAQRAAAPACFTFDFDATPTNEVSEAPLSEGDLP